MTMERTRREAHKEGLDMGRFTRGVISGAAAGAVGVTALNSVTYLDMLVRARPASSTPEESVRRLAGKTGITIPGNDEQRSNRIAGLGPLLGIAAGLMAGVALGVARGFGWRPNPVVGTLAATGVALLAGNAPMTLLKVTDPRHWSPSDWLSDLVPHLAFGVAAQSVLGAGR